MKQKQSNSIRVPSVPGPKGLCWTQDPKELKRGDWVSPYCTLPKGHKRRGQPHTWERPRKGAGARDTMTNNGGSAFPEPIGDTSGLSYPPDPGMTLRDYFAAQVISQCHITVEKADELPDVALIKAFAGRFARSAYIIADAMIAERAATK